MPGVVARSCPEIGDSSRSLGESLHLPDFNITRGSV